VAPPADEPSAPGRRARRAQPGVAPVRPSRAGRNLPAAIAVGVGLGGLVLASLLIRKEAFVAVVAMAVALSVWELTQAFAARRISVPLVPLLVGALGMVISAYTSGEEALLVAFTLTALALLLWRVLDGLDGAVRDVAAGIFAAAYVPFLAGFVMLMLAADDGPQRIIVFILVTVASDVGGYAVGVLAGRHPLAPSVSPKKSWEGLGGSAAACVVAGVLSVTLLLDGPWWAGALVGLATVVTATVGDLSESLLKRDLGIKDMGSVLPGHGGMLDRIDSLLPTAPVAYLLLALLVPVAG
jgi:phosphatidate cytidylyltransferase